MFKGKDIILNRKIVVDYVEYMYYMFKGKDIALNRNVVELFLYFLFRKCACACIYENIKHMKYRIIKHIQFG